MAASKPVVIIHAKNKCPACESLLKPSSFTKLKETGKRVNPDVRFEVIHHEKWGRTKSNPSSPNIGILTYAPVIMVVPSEHANPDGNIESAIFYGFDFNQNKNTVVPKRTNLTRELWLEKVLEPSTFESHAQKYPVSNTVPSRRNRSSDRPSSSA